MNLRPTPLMKAARNVGEMADAFNPLALWDDRLSHPSRVYDALEAALLYGAGRIPARDFLAAVEDLGEWDES